MHNAHCSPQKRLGHMGSVHQFLLQCVIQFCANFLKLPSAFTLGHFFRIFCLWLKHAFSVLVLRIYQHWPSLYIVYCWHMGKKKKPRTSWQEAKVIEFRRNHPENSLQVILMIIISSLLARPLLSWGPIFLQLKCNRNIKIGASRVANLRNMENVNDKTDFGTEIVFLGQNGLEGTLRL